MSNYAVGTGVPVSKSVLQLDAIVGQYGGSAFAYGRDETTGIARVMFAIGVDGERRTMRFEVARPTWQEFRRSKGGTVRSQPQAQAVAEMEERRRWRCLILIVKALFVAVEDGVMTQTEAFLAHMVMPGDGRTVAQWATEQMPTLHAGGPAALMPGAMSR